MDYTLILFVLLGAFIGNMKMIIGFLHLVFLRFFGTKTEEIEDKIADSLDEASKELRKKEGD